jgi:hypothetical protein
MFDDNGPYLKSLRMSLVHNERTKLLANALDRASTASLTVGVLAPIAAALYTSASASAWTLRRRLGLLDFRSRGATYIREVRPQEVAMTGLQIFAFIVLPLTIAAAGAAVAYFYGSNDRSRLHPGE